MRQHIVIIACLCSALVYALPVADNQDGFQIVQIPLSDNKELDIVSVDSDGRLSERSKRTIGILRDLFPELTKLNAGDNSIDLTALNEQLQETIRVARQAAANDNLITSGDQTAAESKSPAIDELTLEDDTVDGDDRNKRFLPFGFGGSASASSGSASGGGAGGGAGSGNFLFDIIRNSAGRAARAVGTAYRFVAGADDNEVDGDTIRLRRQMSSLPRQMSSLPRQMSRFVERTAKTLSKGLFSGSVQTQQGDERANEPASSSEDTSNAGASAGASADGYTEGIPGPVTRLVVLANRGLANLIQDLILLFSGSVQTQQGDERANEPASSSEDTSNAGASAGASADGYTEGIPGPVTRLVVLANRGLANLIQDLILRVAATSERLVNFKARLITSLI